MHDEELLEQLERALHTRRHSASEDIYRTCARCGDRYINGRDVFCRRGVPLGERCE